MVVVRGSWKHQACKSATLLRSFCILVIGVWSLNIFLLLRVSLGAHNVRGVRALAVGVCGLGTSRVQWPQDATGTNKHERLGVLFQNENEVAV